ncbi:hypothetical protein M9H77_17143 [Catharanthus roseus]|uniref:Uncharacterized protein n=1 Tax=Catharanthus roseus TaxID=4058 RepID=A0ACC0B3S7_CATRO|nr:hypothetical protein M9H77_17143 [Catharanthus roseus]
MEQNRGAKFDIELETKPTAGELGLLHNNIIRRWVNNPIVELAYGGKIIHHGFKSDGFDEEASKDDTFFSWKADPKTYKERLQELRMAKGVTSIIKDRKFIVRSTSSSPGPSCASAEGKSFCKTVYSILFMFCEFYLIIFLYFYFMEFCLQVKQFNRA